MKEGDIIKEGNKNSDIWSVMKPGSIVKIVSVDNNFSHSDVGKYVMRFKGVIEISYGIVILGNNDSDLAGLWGGGMNGYSFEIIRLVL